MKSAKEIVAEAWNITIEYRSHLFRLGFVPAFFSILVTAWYLYYQVQSFRYSSLFSDGKDAFLFSFLTKSLAIISADSAILASSLIFLAIILLGYFFTPLLCRAAIVHLVSQIKLKKEVKKGFTSAFFRFFPLFEVSALKGVLQPISFFTEFSFVARNIPGAIPLVAPFLIFFVFLGLLILFVLVYTTQAIMVCKKDFTGAISCSTRMAIENIGKTFQIFVLFLLVELRVLINILVILAFPLVVASVTGIFASLFSDQVGILLAVLAAFFFIFLAAYLSGILFVFSETIWTVAFFELYEETFEKPIKSREKEYEPHAEEE